MAVIKSSLGFYNIMASVSLEWNHPDFISIGPFCDEKISKAFIHRIVSNRKLTQEQATMAEKFYEILPYADVNDVTLMTQHLLCAFIPEYRDVSPEYLNYSEETHEFKPNSEAFEHFTTSSAEFYAKYLMDFLETLVSGDWKEASDKLKIFLDASGAAKKRSLHSMKRNIHELNTFCKEKLLTTSVHPYDTLSLADSFESEIEACANQEQLASLPYKMVRNYCLLVKNRMYPEYSCLIRNVISYINQHLNEDLSLSILARQFNKNASFLSGQFSRETGMSLTRYIHHVRIQRAVQYFNTTDLSVSETALNVGFSDFGYFSKLFHKEIGTSPRAYKKMLKARNDIALPN